MAASREYLDAAGDHAPDLQALTFLGRDVGIGVRLNGNWVARQPHVQAGRVIYEEPRYTEGRTGQEVYAPYCHITPKGLVKLAQVFASEALQAAKLVPQRGKPQKLRIANAF